MGTFFQIYAWGKNLFDEVYATRAFEWECDWVGRAGDPATLASPSNTGFRTA